MPESAPLHPVNRRHLDVLSDRIGIMQHAIGSRPDPAHGYCTDDVARALQADLLHQRELGWSAVEESVHRSVRFLAEAFDSSTGRFRNFRRVDGSWIDGVPSEDSQGRAMLALGEAVADAPDSRVVNAAAALFEAGLPATRGLTALRPHASILLGCDAAVRGGLNGAATQAYLLTARRLRDTFAMRPLSPWPWPEPRLTYENALPARALIVAGRHLASRQMSDLGLLILDWLIDVQTAPAGHFSPVGNGWWRSGGVKSQFDQQPIEATAMIMAAGSAHAVTGDDRYRTAMEHAYGWFLGRNDLGVHIADPSRGAGGDALTARGRNTNEGAESTLMWLMAVEHIRALRQASRAAEPREAAILVATAS